jgi:ParB/RepB/Spo0J family partition protein
VAKRIPTDLGDVERTAPTKFRKPAAVEQAEEQVRRTGRLRRIRLDRLQANSHQPSRRHHDVADLAESIATHGMLHPPIVRRTKRNRYEVVAGHRRVAAWRALAFSGRAGPEMLVSVLDDVDDRSLLRLMVAENHHREAPDVLHEAETLGRYAALLATELGREPTVRELAAEVPPERTCVQRLLTIYRALQDEELSPLVRGADIQDKSLLYRVLRAPELLTTRAALESAAAGGAAEDLEAIITPRKRKRPGGRPPKAVTRHDRGEGAYDLTLRVRVTMRPDEVSQALAEAERAVADLRAMRTRLEELP